MDKTSKLFDVWAKTGRSEEMEKEHGSVLDFSIVSKIIKEKLK